MVYPDDLDILKGIVTGKHDLDSTITLRWLCRDGRVIWIEQRNVPVYAADGRLVAIEGIVRDITVRKQMEQKLRHLSLHDLLTGLFNRAYFELEIQRLEKTDCYPVGVILCDVDGLKLVKVGIPDQILFKPDPLNQEVLAAEMRRHCEIGHRIALAAPDLTHIADWILKHHEWWNGQGYPLGLKEEEIPLECRILAIADAYDAMTSDRPYRKAMPPEKAMEELERCAGKQFDPLLVKSFINVLEQIKFKIVPG